MGIFNKNNGNCCCNNINQNTINKMQKYENTKFIILGSCCDNCEKLEKNLQEALNHLNITEEIENITDPMLISMYGVIQHLHL